MLKNKKHRDIATMTNVSEGSFYNWDWEFGLRKPGRAGRRAPCGIMPQSRSDEIGISEDECLAACGQVFQCLLVENDETVPGQGDDLVTFQFFQTAYQGALGHTDHVSQFGAGQGFTQHFAA